MSNSNRRIDCFGKPYTHVGWRADGCPQFRAKPQNELRQELSTRGLEPVFDQDGWFVGTRKQTTAENPCLEMCLTPADAARGITLEKFGKKRLYGHRLYDGPAVDVTLWQDDASMQSEVYIKQHRLLTDKTIRFGPLSTSLTSLFGRGYWLEMKLEYKHFNIHATRRSKVYLTDGVDRYRLYSIGLAELQTLGEKHGQYDLGALIPDNINLLRTHSSAKYPKPIIQEKVIYKERDPFEVLAERYPTKKTPKLTLETVIGNRTLGERLADHV